MFRYMYHHVIVELSQCLSILSTFRCLCTEDVDGDYKINSYSFSECLGMKVKMNNSSKHMQ